ncbi:hypothetical protein DPEC_G00347040 [Dallia pectoralis]|uniref:Uncharacterized protein n=1 Tax=Dallia pectoralis TaxID=75939 RepID=A0ACC2F435_DALPE|nr:hypothetical protein DPEC_G00347040 [Dallia pectoralis]
MHPHVLLGFLFGHFIFLMEASDLIHRPRVTWTVKDGNFPRIHLLENNTYMKFVQGHQDTLYAAGNTHVYRIDFHRNSPRLLQRSVFRAKCDVSTSADCQYNITVLHKSKNANQLFLCGTNGQKPTLCCYAETKTDENFQCIPSNNNLNINQQINENDPTLLNDRSEVEEFYATHSGPGNSPGIYRFNNSPIWSDSSQKEQIYMSLVASGKREDSVQDRLYTFYIEKNTDQSGRSHLWVPRVAQVCVADRGGPKNILQMKWTSMLNSRLYCGDPDRKLYFTDLVEVTTVVADRWQDTRIYTLFKDAWGTRAICVYRVEDIDHVFTTSKFKGQTDPIPKPRPGECVEDSIKLPSDVLKMANTRLEMEDWVGDHNKPLMVTHHHYNHINVDSIQGNRTVLLLSLEDGRIHTFLERNGQGFIIVEIQPFNQRTHILSMWLNSSTRKLYVGTSRELVQIDLVSCARYGDHCEECVMSRDPYCGWDGNRCTTATNITIQDVDNGNPIVCKINGATSSKVVSPKQVRVPVSSPYVLQCPTLSNHAEISWRHSGNNTPTPCAHIEAEHKCILLIESMSPEQEGEYSCMSEERGYRTTLAMFSVKLGSGATGLASFYTVCFWMVLTLLLVPL